MLQIKEKNSCAEAQGSVKGESSDSGVQWDAGSQGEGAGRCCSRVGECRTHRTWVFSLKTVEATEEGF